MDFKTGIKRMIDNIDEYRNKKISIDVLKENLFALYEFVDGRINDEFADGFHKYWDYIEEVCAMNKIAEYKKIIENNILPELNNFLLQQLND